jgi:cytochrome c553
MKSPVPVVAVLVSLASFAPARAANVPEPAWAYGYLTPPEPGEKIATPAPAAKPSKEELAEQARPRRAEGSTRAFSLTEIQNRRDVVDWFPDEHPPMPSIVKHGSPGLGDKAYGCALCHQPHGRGRPENAPVSGLPAVYFLRQLQDFRSGLRSSTDQRKSNTKVMITLAQAMTDEEMKSAAEYFSAIAYAPWIRVVETDLVPKTEITSARMFRAIATARTEPIAGRIIEVPEDVEQAELRNPHASFVAYVPTGSIRQGEALVTTGGATIVDGKIVAGKTVACITCHGPELKGMNDSPPLAGRSPSYLVRQLYDIQQGMRKSPLSQSMLPVVANLTNEDFVAIAAYVSSRRAGQ